MERMAAAVLGDATSLPGYASVGVSEQSASERSGASTGPAVVVGLSLDWNNGPVEGSVNRIKMIKRQMYGRAGLDLLRRRVMAP